MIYEKRREKRFRRRILLAAIALFVGALLVSIWLFGPAPPREIVLATGEESGIYNEIGKEYQKRLDKMGLKVRLHYTQGSMENLNLLLEGKVDVALVQAGTYGLIEDEEQKERLRGLMAIQVEPVWVFYRTEGEPVEHLFDLKNRFDERKTKCRIGIGLADSGTAAVAQALLQANGIGPKDADLVHETMAQSAQRLRSGQIDAGFFVTSANNPVVHQLMEDEDIELFSFGRSLAYSRHFPFLLPVVLGEGVIDLKKNIPDEDIKMFATSTLMVCRDDFHPQAVEQILIAGRKIHAQPALVSTSQDFPTLEGMDVPVHDTAQAYMLSGESLVTRLLPYWGVWLWFKVQILILPLLLVWLPFFRIFPLVYTLRINMLLRKHYVALREIEDRIETTDDAEVIKAQIDLLDSLRKDMEKVSRKIPSHLQINVYQWRLHVSHVRAEAQDRLWRMAMEQRTAAAVQVEAAPPH